MFKLIGWLLIAGVAFLTASILFRVPSAPLLLGIGILGACLAGLMGK